MSQASVHDESISRDKLHALGEEIAKFAATLDVATHALITRLRTFDEHEGWAREDFPTCAHWLSWRTGIGLNAAREKVRVARALGELPQIDAVFGEGKLSFSKVRAITRVATPKTEQDYIGIALNATASQVERLCQAYRRSHEDGDPAKPKPRRYVRRSKTFGGMERIEMQLPPEEAEIVWDALRSASKQSSAGASPSDGEHERGSGSGETVQPVSGSDRTSAVTSGRKAATPDEQVSTDPHEHADGCCSGAPVLPANDGEAQEEARADAMVDMARGYLKLRPRTLGSGYEVVVITTRGRLEKGADTVGAVMRDGTPLPLEVARMLACDSARVNVTADETGALLDVGRSTRTIPSAIARALWLRDGCCRAPGCGRRRHLHAHHMQHWADGGPTCLSNLVLLCSQHHRSVHEGRLFVEVLGGKLVFRDAHGLERPSAPPSAATGEELEAMERFLRDAGMHIDPSLNEPMWDGTRLDLDQAMAWISVAEQTMSAHPG